MLLWEKPGEQRSGFFFDKIPDIFSKRTNQFRGNTAHQGQTHAVRNNPSHYLGVSAYRSIAQLALCGRLGAFPRQPIKTPTSRVAVRECRLGGNQYRLSASQAFLASLPAPSHPAAAR